YNKSMIDPFNFYQKTIQRFQQAQTLLDQLRPESTPQALILPGSPEPAGNIIVFPGSFNPPTNAHLTMLEEAQQFAHSPNFLVAEDNRGLLLYAAISKRIIDKENVERQMMDDRIILIVYLVLDRILYT